MQHENTDKTCHFRPVPELCLHQSNADHVCDGVSCELAAHAYARPDFIHDSDASRNHNAYRHMASPLHSDACVPKDASACETYQKCNTDTNAKCFGSGANDPLQNCNGLGNQSNEHQKHEPDITNGPLQSPQQQLQSQNRHETLKTLLNSPSNADRNARSFYRRVLPSSCIAFNSTQGKHLFKSAIHSGEYMESYFSLSLQYLTQSEPAFCGLGSLCMVLNALGIDPLRQWKGVWRWYDETMLECCRLLEDIRQTGISLGEFVCLARCNGLDARLARPDSCSKDAFINDLKECCKSSDLFMVVSYNRATLQQTGTGHFSPIGGYNEAEKMVLVLDVARFKYPAYWVSVDMLWESLHPIDEATGKPRGYVVLSRSMQRPYVSSVFSQLGVTCTSWPTLANIFFSVLPKRLHQMSPDCTIDDVISLVVSAIPDEFDCVVENRIGLFLPLSLSLLVGEGGSTGDGACSEYAQSQNACALEVITSMATLSTSDPSDTDWIRTYLTGLDDLIKQITATDLYSTVAASIGARRKLKTVNRMLKEAVMPAGILPSATQQSRTSIATRPIPAVPSTWSVSSTSTALDSPLADHVPIRSSIVTPIHLAICSIEQEHQKPPDIPSTTPQQTDTPPPPSHPLHFPTTTPEHPSKAVLTRAKTLLTISRRNSVATLVAQCTTQNTSTSTLPDTPTSHSSSPSSDPQSPANNHFTAFLTLFLYALFTFRPSIYETMQSQRLVEQVRGLVSACRVDANRSLWREIEVLCARMAALNELE